MLFDWMSTEMNIAVDRHLKHTPRLVSHGTTTSTAVLLKLDIEASLDLHIEEQLHRICRCFLSFSFRRCILRHPNIEFYQVILFFCFLSILASLQGFLSAESHSFFDSQNGPVIVLYVARAFLAFFNMFLYVWYLFLPLAGTPNVKPQIRLSEKPWVAIQLFYNKHNCEIQYNCQGVRQTELPWCCFSGGYLEWKS